MYSPKIREDLVEKLFQIKQKTGKAMTKQVNEALRQYVAKFELNERDENPREANKC